MSLVIMSLVIMSLVIMSLVIKPSGGARRDRTDDLMLAKHALSQLSYGPVTRRRMRRSIKWWAWEDLNFRPHAYQARALTNGATSPGHEGRTCKTAGVERRSIAQRKPSGSVFVREER